MYFFVYGRSLMIGWSYLGNQLQTNLTQQLK